MEGEQRIVNVRVSGGTGDLYKVPVSRGGTVADIIKFLKAEHNIPAEEVVVCWIGYKYFKDAAPVSEISDQDELIVGFW